MKQRGFTLIELMIVIAIISIIVAIAMPNLVESRKAANEATAVSCLRTISSAQELYNNRYASYGVFSQLVGVNMIDPVLAVSVTASSPKCGYYFIVSVSPSGASWTCVARPSDWDITGIRNFKIDQTGVIYYNLALSSNTWVTPLGS